MNIIIINHVYLEKRKAMTLIELIISMGILVIIIGSTTTFFISSYKNINTSEEKADLQKAVRDVVNEFSQTILNGEKVTLQNGVSSIDLINEASGIISFYMKDGSIKKYKLADNQFQNTSGNIISYYIKSIHIDLINNNQGIYMKVIASEGDTAETLDTTLYFRKELSYTIEKEDSGTENTGDTNVLGELVFFSKALELKNNAVINSEGALYVNGDVKMGHNNSFKGNILSSGKIQIGDNKAIQGNLYAHKKIDIGHNGSVIGDIKSNDEIKIGNNEQINGDLYALKTVVLGHNGSLAGYIQTNEKIEIGDNKKITGDLYAIKKVDIGKDGTLTGDVKTKNEIMISQGNSIIGHLYALNKVVLEKNSSLKGSIQTNNEIEIEENSSIDGSLYAIKKIELKKNGTLKGDVKTNGEIKIQDNKNITANLFANKKIELGKNGSFTGDIKSNDEIKIGENKKVTGNLFALKDITLEKNSRINGNVTTNSNINISTKKTSQTITGDATENTNISKFPKIDSVSFELDKIDPVEIPMTTIKLRTENFYNDNGYFYLDSNNNKYSSGYSKFYTEKDINKNLFNTIYKYTTDGIVIVSGGNINIDSYQTFKGILVADGDITIKNISNFEGIIICNGKFKYENDYGRINLTSPSNFFNSSDEYPWTEEY